MAHVLMGVIMVLLASYRLHVWRKLCPEEDDEHAAQARTAPLAARGASAAAPVPPCFGAALASGASVPQHLLFLPVPPHPHRCAAC